MMIPTLTPEAGKVEMPESVRVARLLKHGLLGLLILCLLGVGAYALLTKSGEAQPRVAPPGASAGGRTVPVVAVAAITGDVGLCLRVLVSINPYNVVTNQSRVCVQSD